jgi:hypothetical protein
MMTGQMMCACGADDVAGPLYAGGGPEKDDFR